MPDKEVRLLIDIENVQKIPIVPTILEVVCKTTGMGFAAIARVTQERWIACSVEDEIQFGLLPGGELRIETTICDEIREHRELVIIEHVDADATYCNHPTAKMYGFQSYISIPIVLKNGEFFGTLCAIDPRPAELNNPKTIGMFNLFADLISFHLQSIDLIDRSNNAVKDLSRQLTDTKDENRQYQHISNHNLQEPLRKIRMFSNMLVKAAEQNNIKKVKELALKVDSGAQRFSMMIKDLSDFSELNLKDSSFEIVDLNKIIADVCIQLNAQIQEKSAVVNVKELLPAIHALPIQMEQLFYHLISNAIKFSRRNTIPVIEIYYKELSPTSHKALAGTETKYVEISVKDNGIGIERSQLEKIFDIFSKLPYDHVPYGGGIGLAYCRKIIRNHGGIITAQSEFNKGTIFSITLPVDRKLSRDFTTLSTTF